MIYESLFFIFNQAFAKVLKFCKKSDRIFKLQQILKLSV